MITRTWIDMGMPITLHLADTIATEADCDTISAWFAAVDARYSPFRTESDVSRLNAGTLRHDEVSDEFATILECCEQARIDTDGVFDIVRDGRLDPSGYVKGWAISQASTMLATRGLPNHMICAGGDLQTSGYNADGEPWRVGIRNPFHHEQIVKTLAVSGMGVATSGTDARGEHIYDPRHPGPLRTDLVSLTVVAPDIARADLMATAAFAMGHDAFPFLIAHHLDAYAIDRRGIATFIEGFARHVQP